MASVEPASSDGVITRQFLKSKSGEFDVQSILRISLINEGISDLGYIGECSCLECLDLSYNNINRLHKLASLTSLTRLSLVANRITSLDGLQSLVNLQSLNVCGNLIGSVDVLRYVAELDKLTNLKLQDPVSGLSNPLCNTSYVDQVLIILPSVHILDGQRVRGRGSELYEMCRFMDKTLNTLPSITLDTLDEDDQTEIQARNQLMVTPQEEEEDKVLKEEANIRGLLSACRALSEQADTAVTELQQTLTLISAPDRF